MTRRRLTASEDALWRAVKKSVRPLGTPTPPETPLGAQPAPPPRLSRGKPAPAPPPDLTAAPSRTAARLGAGDPRQARRIARGQREIDGTLDLHGLTQTQAYARLCRFVEVGAATGARTLLVVTGKGRGEARVPFAEAPRGILRERFLQWVEQDPLRGLIASVRPAHQKHGGRGAFYVMLKRVRDSGSARERGA